MLLQVLNPIHQAIGLNLGDRTAAWLYSELTDACLTPPGMGHLEDPRLTNDLAFRGSLDPPAERLARQIAYRGRWEPDRRRQRED